MGDGGFSWCLGALEGLVVFVWGDCCFAMVGAGRRPAPTIAAGCGQFSNGAYGLCFPALLPLSQGMVIGPV